MGFETLERRASLFSFLLRQSITHKLTSNHSTMGKKNKKRGRQHDGGHRPNKKHHKKGGYWINTCRESKPKEGKPDALMTVVISQANLTDDHTHVAREKGQESVIDASKEPKSVGKVSTTESKTLEVSKDTAKETAAEAECSSPMKDSHAAKSQEENSKQGVDYSHAFISVQRLSSASGPQKVVRSITWCPSFPRARWCASHLSFLL